MAAPVEFYGPITIYVCKEQDEWAAYVDPFSIAGEGPTRKKAVESAILNLTELLKDLARDVRKYGPENVEVLCPLESKIKRESKMTLTALVFASSRPIKAHVVPAEPRIRPFTRDSFKRTVARSASIGVIPPATLATV